MKLDDLKWAVGELVRAAIGQPTFRHGQAHCICEACDDSGTEIEAGYESSRFACEAVEDHSAASAKRDGS